MKNLKKLYKLLEKVEDFKAYKFVIDYDDGRPETIIEYGVDAEDAKQNLLKDHKYLQDKPERVSDGELVPEDHEEVTEDFMMIHKSGDGPDASGQVTFFPTAFGYEYKCTENDFNGRGPQWSTIRTVEGIRNWFRNVLFEFGAKEVTIGEHHWDIDDFPKNESLNEAHPEVSGFKKTFYTRGGNKVAKIIYVDNRNEGNPTEAELYFDGQMVAKLVYKSGTDSDFATSIERIEVFDNVGYNDLIGLLVENYLDEEVVDVNESLNEDVMETDIELIDSWLTKLGFEDAQGPQGYVFMRKTGDELERIVVDNDKLTYTKGEEKKEFPFSNTIEIQKAFKALNEPLNEKVEIDVKNPGILEVPEGKSIEDLPQSHFEKLVDKKGYEEIIRALTNLEVWNKDKNKQLSSWASNMADKLKKKFRPENVNEEENTIKVEIEKLIKDNELPYDICCVKEDTVGVEVDGDWKHDHAYFNNLMRKQGFTVEDEEIIEDGDGGDSYKAIYYYSKLDESLNESVQGAEEFLRKAAAAAGVKTTKELASMYPSVDDIVNKTGVTAGTEDLADAQKIINNKINESVDEVIDADYPAEVERENFIVVYTDGSTDDKFIRINHDIIYDDDLIESLYDAHDKLEIADIIASYAELALGKEVEEVRDIENKPLTEAQESEDKVKGMCNVKIIKTLNKLDHIIKHTNDEEIKQRATSLMDELGLGVDVVEEAEKLFKEVEKEFPEEEVIVVKDDSRKRALNGLMEELEDLINEVEFVDNEVIEGKDLHKIWNEEMLNEPILETAEGVVYLQPSEDGKHIQYGSLTNGGMIIEGEVEYDFDLSLDSNIQGVAEEVFEKYGYPVVESYEKYLRKSQYEDIQDTKKEIDKAKQQGKSIEDIKTIIAVHSDDEEEQEEAENYAVEKLTETLLATSKTSLLKDLKK